MNRKTIGLIGAAGSLLILYFASGSPIPLYTMYQAQLGLTHAELSMTSVYYLVGTVISLLFFPRLSDHLGRRPVTVMILAISFLGCVVFANLDSPAMLMGGRLIQGIVSGLGSSTIAAYVVDLCSGLPVWVGPAITSSAPTLGLSSGAFISGGLIQYTSVTTDVYFTAIMVLIVVLAVLVVTGMETVRRNGGTMRSIVPKISIPPSARRMFAASAMIFVGTWAIGGFSQAYSSTIAEFFGSSNAFFAAAVFTSMLLPNAVGGFFANRFDTRVAQRYGMGIFALCMLLLLVSLHIGSIVLFFAGSIVAGFAQGIAFTGSVSGLLSRTTLSARAGMFSTIYLTSYGGAAIPNLIVGMLPGTHPVEEILSWYAILTVVMFVVVIVITRREYEPYRSPEIGGAID